MKAASPASPPDHILGKSQIQNEKNRTAFPDSIKDLGIFSDDRDGEPIFWGYDREKEWPVFSNQREVLDDYTYVGLTTYGSGDTVVIPKKFFPDYKGRNKYDKPVRQEIRLKYGIEVYIGCSSRITDGIVECYIISVEYIRTVFVG